MHVLTRSLLLLRGRLSLRAPRAQTPDVSHGCVVLVRCLEEQPLALHALRGALELVLGHAKVERLRGLLHALALLLGLLLELADLLLDRLAGRLKEYIIITLPRSITLLTVLMAHLLASGLVLSHHSIPGDLLMLGQDEDKTELDLDHVVDLLSMKCRRRIFTFFLILLDTS